MTRAEHLAWAKGRALEYVQIGDLDQAITSMASDLTKHSAWDTPGAHSSIAFLVLAAHMGRKTTASVTKWINGFN